ncbi:TERF1-interacting nuclear factor 2 isoform X3 [Gouania willdenowi]|uniref:TERF1-interacting nuclear factor 2 isoform X3 n=1 Tax=Gouania willdenowi TaxID=441366 RepID=UPI00105447E8|nr:TERF1-interacting nuclear factor 2 isoform X3 [Gouania willdenowi]
MNTKENDVSLPFAALQLLAPPVRLVSAALWKVLKQRDVMQYGVVEEFVTSACETVPGLLTPRHQVKLALGLRARLILELCSKQPDVEVIQPHLERIKAPASTVKKDVKVSRTLEHFHSLVQVFLSDSAERELFFKEEFPVEYGPKFDQELEKLLWEFLIRLDQLLPAPNLKQTVSWLSDTPPVLEECVQAATQPQLLEMILQHQTCLGHLETAASLPPNMGDSILASLSLPPSGRVPTKQPTEAAASLSKQEKPLVQPAFVLISNDDVPVMMAARKRAQQSEKTANQSLSFTSIKQKTNDDKEEVVSTRSARMKREQGDDEEEAVGSRKKKPKERLSKEIHMDDEDEDGFLSSIKASCLSKQPHVVLERLTLDGAGVPEPSRKSPIKAPTRKRTRGLKDKDRNQPVKSQTDGRSSPQQRATDGGDYVADSEDEATKNFKGRLFVKRYYKTKHGTYVPTLREFWKPRTNRQDSVSMDRKHRQR